jgi:hypothetical protein
MPAPTVEQFVDAVKQTVLANKRWVCTVISSQARFITLCASPCHVCNPLTSYVKLLGATYW